MAYASATAQHYRCWRISSPSRPLQGALFRKFRDVISGYKHVSSPDLDLLPKNEERVGNQRAEGGGTDGPSADSAVIVDDEKMTQLPKNISWADVVKGTRGQERVAYDKRVSRAHSLETIQLAK